MLNREELLDVLRSFQIMIENSGDTHPTAVISDISASIRHILEEENQETDVSSENMDPCDGEDHYCPYEAIYTGFTGEMCRVCCGKGVDEDSYPEEEYDE